MLHFGWKTIEHTLLCSFSSLLTPLSSHFPLSPVFSFCSLPSSPFPTPNSSSFHAPLFLPSVSIICCLLYCLLCSLLCCLLLTLSSLSSLLPFLYTLCSTPSSWLSCLLPSSSFLASSLLHFYFNFPPFLLPSCPFMTPSSAVLSSLYSPSLLYSLPAAFSPLLPSFSLPFCLPSVSLLTPSLLIPALPAAVCFMPCQIMLLISLALICPSSLLHN